MSYCFCTFVVCQFHGLKTLAPPHLSMIISKFVVQWVNAVLFCDHMHKPPFQMYYSTSQNIGYLVVTSVFMNQMLFQGFLK